jgi:hypothetical protein
MKKRVFNLIIVDESGSMEIIRKQAFAGMNETLETVRTMQKQFPETEQHVTLITFDSDHTKYHYDDNRASEIQQLKWHSYCPGGATPLYDAMGKAISKLNAITEKDEKTGEKVTKNDYDRDAIYKALKSFADAYNDTLDDTAESTNTSILRQASFMTKITSSSAKVLGYAGITIGADNKLSVDEDFVKSDMDVEAAKRAFSGNNSFGSQIALKSTTIKNQANSAANNYTKNGGYASSDYSSYNAWM